jgi:hypothetical protein
LDAGIKTFVVYCRALKSAGAEIDASTTDAAVLRPAASAQ